MNELKGFKTLPKWLKLKYIESVRGICQGCHKSKSEIGILQIHRLKRGNLGGLYTLAPLNSKSNNVKVLCKNCHKKIHSNEIGVTK